MTDARYVAKVDDISPLALNRTHVLTQRTDEHPTIRRLIFRNRSFPAEPVSFAGRPDPDGSPPAQGLSLEVHLIWCEALGLVAVVVELAAECGSDLRRRTTSKKLLVRTHESTDRRLMRSVTHPGLSSACRSEMSCPI
jgi:hypothetical protein